MNEGAGKIVNSLRLNRDTAIGDQDVFDTQRHIGIALAVYQPDVAYFAEQLASIVAQTYRDWSCTITLDSPLDELRTRVELAPFVDDARFRWLENPTRLGHKKNFEHAIALVAAGDAWAIAFCDQDDIWYPAKLEVLSNALRTLTLPSLVHSDMHLLVGDGILDATLWQQARKSVYNVGCWQLLVWNKVTGCTVMLHAELARSHAIIPEPFTFHDHWFAVMASVDGSVVAVPQVLGAYRQHGANVLGAERFGWSVTPGILTRLVRELGDCQSRWVALKTRTLAVVGSGVTLPTSARRMILSKYDMGVRMAIAGIRFTLSDPRLSRYCLRVAIGKFLFTLRGNNRH